MTDDLLERAAKALREESEEGDAGVRFTRARVMAGLQQNAARRRTRLAFALPLAACFAAATAFGTMKARQTELWHDVVEALGFTQVDEAPKQKPKAPKRPTAPPKAIEAPPVEAPPVEAPPVDAPPLEQPAQDVTPPVETPTPAPAPVAPKSSSALSNRPPREAGPTREPVVDQAPPTPAAPATPPETSDPAHELYRVAHQSHFVDHNFASALRAWDAYLAAAPSGRFAPEARYNRALCLVRLGRKDDAERALRPFADGVYGGYRRDEAKALIEALQR
ncbi:MAG: hypothetical protein ACOY0T_17505 [Myxococcota bacterium]